MKTVMFELPGVVSTAFEVLAGQYGNGAERKRKLTAAGYDYDEVQACVNDLCEILAKYGGD